MLELLTFWNEGWNNNTAIRCLLTLDSSFLQSIRYPSTYLSSGKALCCISVIWDIKYLVSVSISLIIEKFLLGYATFMSIIFPYSLGVFKQSLNYLICIIIKCNVCLWRVSAPFGFHSSRNMKYSKLSTSRTVRFNIRID